MYEAVPCREFRSRAETVIPLIMVNSYRLSDALESLATLTMMSLVRQSLPSHNGGAPEVNRRVSS